MCSIDSVVLQEYIDDELELAERLVFKEHLRNCPSCRRHLNQLKIIDWDLHHLESPIPQELSQVRHATLETHFQNQDINSQKAKGLIALPQHIIALSTSFIQYTPHNWLLKTAKQKFIAQSSKLSQKRFSQSLFEKLLRI